VPDGAADLSALFSRIDWIGGLATVSAELLGLSANRANRAAHVAVGDTAFPADFAVRLLDITDVRVRPARLGIGASTIEVRLRPSEAVVGIRCRGAAGFAARIETARIAAGGSMR
jgi:hypothetical protein